MIKSGALLMSVVMAAVSSGTYFGLEMLPEGAIPPPFGRSTAREPVAPAPAAPVEVAAAPAPAPAAAPSTPAPAAAEPAPGPFNADPAPAPAATPAPAPAAASPPAETTPVETKPAEVPAAPAAPVEAASPAPASAPAPAADADAIKQWWPEPSTMPANQLKLQYAGQVQGQGAIALLFTAPLKLDSLKEHAVIRNASGDIVAGDWALANNLKMAVFGGLAPGRYTVILQPQISDQQGFMLGTTLKGPVYVKP